MNPPEVWLTKHELARELKCSTRTIDRLDLPVESRVGNMNRYLLSVCKAELRRRLHGTRTPDPANVVRFSERDRGRAA